VRLAEIGLFGPPADEHRDEDAAREGYGMREFEGRDIPNLSRYER